MCKSKFSRRCPQFDKTKPISPLNPNVCVIGGNCNYCPSFCDKSCKGCICNMKKKSDYLK